MVESHEAAEEIFARISESEFWARNLRFEDRQGNVEWENGRNEAFFTNAAKDLAIEEIEWCRNHRRSSSVATGFGRSGY